MPSGAMGIGEESGPGESVKVVSGVRRALVRLSVVKRARLVVSGRRRHEQQGGEVHQRLVKPFKTCTPFRLRVLRCRSLPNG
jgi:hypothetical protein